MASKIRICSHNVRGFSDRKEFLSERCNSDPHLIQCIQEHWLPPPFKKKAGTNALRSVHPDFEAFSTSAMKKAEENEIRRGRGFGGTGFIYPKSISGSIKPLVKYNHERLTAMELSCETSQIIIINVYMPFLDRTKLQETITNYDEMIGLIDYIMEERSDAKFVILGDFNCNIFDTSHPFSSSLNDFLNSRDLKCTFEKMNDFHINDSYTRFDSRSRSLLDYIFVSPGLIDLVHCVSIKEYHNNFSDHLPIEIEIELCLSKKAGNGKVTNFQNSVIWSKLSQHDIIDFASTMEIALDLIPIPASIIHGNHICTNDNHKCDIELYCTQIVDAIKKADSLLPKNSHRLMKPYWSPELTVLKRESFSSHKMWVENGKPNSGPLHDKYISSRVNYRRALRQEKRSNLTKDNDKLYENLVNKDSFEFWRQLKRMSSSRDPLPPQIDGCTDDADICDRFANVFSGIYKNNDATAHAKLKTDFYTVYPEYFSSHVNDDISHYFFTNREVIDMVTSLKGGKAYVGLVKAEHILNGSPKLLVHLQMLFNSMLQHGFIPSLLLRGNISPLVKDRDGSLSDSSNYRGVTLSSIFIQMFERLQRSKFSYFLPQSDMQFGFQPKISTSHAIFSVKKTVDYFNNNGSRTYLSFLDCTKAFDRISHWGLFLKLLKQGVPLCFLLCVMYLYLNMSCIVKWGNMGSDAFDVPTGSKQGGILSPDFFKLYAHDLINKLKDSGYGCYVIQMCIACIFFADDIVLMSPSRHGLQSLLDICVQYCKEFCLDFNTKKSKVMIVGRGANVPETCPLLLNGVALDFVTEYKYLGVVLCSGKKNMSFSATGTIRSFHRAANALLFCSVKPRNVILMKLLYSNCVPVLTYACAVREFSSADMNRCHVALNNAIRRIFSFPVWQSIRQIRIENGFDSVYEIFAKAKTKFLNLAPTSFNQIVRHLASF